MDFFRIVQLLAALLVLASIALASVAPASAHGGGAPQLVQTPSGPYQLYAWTNPNPARVGVVHVTVALTEPSTQRPVLDASVQVVATPADGSPAVTTSATHENATIKTYYEADLTLPAAGLWRFTILHSDSAGSGSASFELDVRPAAVPWRPVGLGAALAVIAAGAWLALRRPQTAGNASRHDTNQAPGAVV